MQIYTFKMAKQRGRFFCFVNFATLLQCSYLCAMFLKKVNWDVVGIITSVACAIHCALLPIILTSLPLLGIEVIHNRAFEYFMIGLAFVIGAFSLLRGYLYKHHQLKPLVIFLIGILFLVAKQFWHKWEIVLLIPAVIFIVYGHLLNNKTCTYKPAVNVTK